MGTDNVSVQVLLGVRIRKLRQEQNITQEKLAELAGLDRSYFGSVERGERNPSLANLVKVASSLGVTLSELVDVDA
jgi:transcriptional regulator with XRE-family HTH domain